MSGETHATTDSAADQERIFLLSLADKPLGARIKGYVSLSGPGWLQSAITLGGGSLANSLYLGVIAGFGMLWLQPLAMILGIIMLSAIGYVTLSTGERPFRAIIKHVNPVLGWGWLIACMLANMVWALPQYSLAAGVLKQNLFPRLLGAGGPLGEFQSNLVIVGSILFICTIVTWSYGSGHWGVRLYERMLKIVVALIVLCFVGVVVRLAMSDSGLEWSKLFAGLVPDFGAVFRPADGFLPLLERIPLQYREYWRNNIVDYQRDVIMGAFATAVGINMTFLLPYSMLSRGWGREHRGLAVFDLSTAMLVPFVLATSCVVVAAATQFHTVPLSGLIAAAGHSSDGGDKPSAAQTNEFNKMLESRIRVTGGKDVTDAERRLAATLAKRDAQLLSRSLEPLLGGRFFSDIVFGLGVLGMALSTISILMLISGFVVCEVMNVPVTGWPLRIGALAAATGVVGPFIGQKANFWLAVPTSVFGATLLPIAYLTFLLLINQRSLMQDRMMTGVRRAVANLLMGVATGVAIFASGWAIWNKAGYYGIAAVAVFIAAVLATHVRGRRVRCADPEA